MSISLRIIENPASGKDIRRLAAHVSVFDNHKKVNIPDISRNRELINFAPVDLLVYGERFTGNGAIRDHKKVRTLVRSKDNPAAIGASTINGYLPVSFEKNEQGMCPELGPGNFSVPAPVAPGLLRELTISHQEQFSEGEIKAVSSAPATLALGYCIHFSSSKPGVFTKNTGLGGE